VTRRRALLAALLVVAAVAGAALFTASQGGYEAHALPRGRPAADAPYWTSICAGRRAGTIPVSARNCARVSGRVVWVQEEHEPGDVAEKHLVLVADWHVRVVKVQDKPGLPKAPGLGRFITATGPITRGSRGEDQVYAFQID
jgi:hypothetical protein